MNMIFSSIRANWVVGALLLVAQTLVPLVLAQQSGQEQNQNPVWTANLDDIRRTATLLPGRRPLRINVVKFAESRRSETERRVMESKVAERFSKLEAEYERRFEKLLQDLHQRFEKSCAMLDAESAERREAMQIQHDELIARLEKAAHSLGHAKTDREELAGLLNEVANRLRAAAAA